jgi:hypothetical protein
MQGLALQGLYVDIIMLSINIIYTQGLVLQGLYVDIIMLSINKTYTQN